MNLDVPQGKKKGLLPRNTKVGETCPVYKPKGSLLSIEDCDEIFWDRWNSESAAIEYYDSTVDDIHDQDGVGSCAAEQCSLGFEVITRHTQDKFVKINPWPMYRETSGGYDRGSTLASNLAFARDTGLVPDLFFPRWRNGKLVNSWKSEPPDGWREIAAMLRLEEYWEVEPSQYDKSLATGLVEGFVAGIGWSGHSELMIGYLPGGRARVANSWDESWGEEGFHTEYIAEVNMGYGAYLYRTSLLIPDDFEYLSS